MGAVDVHNQLGYCVGIEWRWTDLIVGSHYFCTQLAGAYSLSRMHIDDNEPAAAADDANFD